ncbi:hypothetical protein [Amycolatopsis cihanbeyliensis]|uniref:Uncharacterized protein n=1 Tax=Amycolatopsis cihanbeyliensis TaxID=1128664 RepID=A0A542DPW8_AMYCI|nr:hypothetical protein [Amycolatopsis cihanbeyliensis]TQJ05148.1 hypothetical protein FB471_4973 [Amycolatopsis cihanbeyliensis]
MASHVPFGRPLFSLLEDAVVLAEGEHKLTVCGPWGDIEVTDRSPLVREALHRMSLGPVSLGNIPALAEESARWQATGTRGPRWIRLKRTLDALGGCVVNSLGLFDGGGPILSLVADVPDAVFDCVSVAERAVVEVRPGATIEDIEAEQVFRCRGVAYRAVLHRSPATEIAKCLLSGETTITEVAGGLQVGRPVVGDVVAYLAGAGLLLVEGPPNALSGT